MKKEKRSQASAVKTQSLLAVSILVAICFGSCKKIIEVDPPKTQLIKSTVFENDQTAVAALLGLYTRLTSQSGNLTGITYLLSLSADELMAVQGNNQLQYYQNELVSTNINIGSAWTDTYSNIYLANSIIEGLENSNKITAALKSQLIGEAKFFRAFSHFYLVNLFGDVPYIKKTDYRENGLVSRIPIAQVYENIITDLSEAKSLLSEDYSYSKNERVRVNKWAATSLLARVCLYTSDWTRAEEQATEVINKTSLFTLNTDLAKFFLKTALKLSGSSFHLFHRNT